jgi:hypothetical protein
MWKTPAFKFPAGSRKITEVSTERKPGQITAREQVNK